MPLGEALTADVLVEDGQQLSFVHDLFRRVVYDEVPASVRLALHRDAAAALTALGAPCYGSPAISRLARSPGTTRRSRRGPRRGRSVRYLPLGGRGSGAADRGAARR